MSYVDVPFPDCIAFGAESRPTWQTEISVSASGWEQTNQDWSHPRHEFDVSMAVRTASDYMLIRNHFHAVRGRTHRFRFKDPLDFQATASEGVADVAAADWQMYKRYGSGGSAYDRLITRPVSGTVAVFRTRTGITSDVTGSATIDYETGSVSMAGHVAGDVYTWSGEFDIVVRYDLDALPTVIINKQPGAAGELLVDCPSIKLIEKRDQ
jgi:uncharacterized protein (TIGR02217 family)